MASSNSNDRAVIVPGDEIFVQDDRGIRRDPNGLPIAWFTDAAGNVLAVLQQD